MVWSENIFFRALNFLLKEGKLEMAVVGGIEKHVSLFFYIFNCLPFLIISVLFLQTHIQKNYVNKERQMKGFLQFG